MQIPLKKSVVAVFAVIGLASASAHAGPASDPDAPCRARATLKIDVAPTPFDPPLAKIVFEHLFHELDGDGGEGACIPELGAEALSSTARIEVAWPNAQQAEVKVEVVQPHARRAVVRTVSLEKLPPDSRALAVTIAATELLEEIRTQLDLSRPRARPAAKPPAAAPKGPAKAPPAEWLGGLAPTMAFEAFTSGVSLVGPDARLSVALGARVAGVLRFGTRVPIGAGTTSAFVFGASLSASWLRRTAPIGVEAVVRLDGLSRAGPGGVDRRVEAIAASGAGAWIVLDRRARVVADVLVGASLSPTSTRPATTGLSIATSLGVEVSF